MSPDPLRAALLRIVRHQARVTRKEARRCLWRFYQRHGRLPEPDELFQALHAGAFVRAFHEVRKIADQALRAAAP